MNKKPEIIIDESKQWESPSIFKRITHSILSVIFGVVLAQALSFVFIRGFVFNWTKMSYIFIPYLLICAIFGAIYGDKFVFTLRRLIGEWWGLWGSGRY